MPLFGFGYFLQFYIISPILFLLSVHRAAPAQRKSGGFCGKAPALTLFFSLFPPVFRPVPEAADKVLVAKLPADQLDVGKGDAAADDPVYLPLGIVPAIFQPLRDAGEDDLPQELFPGVAEQPPSPS